MNSNDMNAILIRLGVIEAGMHERFENIRELFDGKLDNIIEQTTRTNGKVVKLEEKTSMLDNSYKTLFSALNSFGERLGRLELMKFNFKDIRILVGLLAGLIIGVAISKTEIEEVVVFIKKLMTI